MRELKPYRTVNGLRAAIDNGGRFYKSHKFYLEVVFYTKL